MKDTRESSEGIEVQAEWEGLPDVTDFTWEPLTQLHEDIPELLNSFLESKGKRAMKRKALKILSDMKDQEKRRP